MAVNKVQSAGVKAPSAAQSGPTADKLQGFAESNGMFDGWKGFKPADKSALSGDAAAKFKQLAAKKDGWSGVKNEPKVFTANVDGAKTTWITVENDHGDQAYVFDQKGHALASAFMPETGDDFHWTKGFSIPDYVNH
jgi:hypothetical protein